MVIACGEVPPTADSCGMALLLCEFDIDRARMGDCLDIDGREWRRQRRLAEWLPASRAREAAIVTGEGTARGESSELRSSKCSVVIVA